jgi:hypothetical protein
MRHNGDIWFFPPAPPPYRRQHTAHSVSRAEFGKLDNLAGMQWCPRRFLLPAKLRLKSKVADAGPRLPKQGDDNLLPTRYQPTDLFVCIVALFDRLLYHADASSIASDIVEVARESFVD